jgi:hypothetical protein
VPSSSAIPTNPIRASVHHCQKIGLYEALKEKLLILILISATSISCAGHASVAHATNLN